MKAVLKLTQKRKDDDGADAGQATKSFFLVSKILFDSIGRAVNAQLIFDFEQDMAKHSEKQKKPEGDDLPPDANPMAKPASAASKNNRFKTNKKFYLI